MRGSDRRRISIGRYPLIGIAVAREQAKKLLAEATLRKNSAPAIAVESLLPLFLKASSLRNKPRTTQSYKRILVRHLLPTFGKKRIGEVRARDIMEYIDRLLGTPGEANHVMMAIKVFLSFAKNRHYIEYNPILGTPLPAKSKSRDRVLSELELVAVYRAADELGYPFGHIVKLCLLTGQRRGEIGLLKWEYINTESRVIKLPSE